MILYKGVNSNAEPLTPEISMTMYECRADDEGYKDAKYEIDAPDHETACDAFAERCYTDRDGWEWMNGKVSIFVVREKGMEEEKKFSVSVEFDPSFYCQEIT